MSGMYHGVLSTDVILRKWRPQTAKCRTKEGSTLVVGPSSRLPVKEPPSCSFSLCLCLDPQSYGMSQVSSVRPSPGDCLQQRPVAGVCSGRRRQS